MNKTIAPSQLLGEIGETTVKERFLSMGFQADGRFRLEAGIDGIVEVSLDALYEARDALLIKIVGNMPIDHRRSLLSFEASELDWGFWIFHGRRSCRRYDGTSTT